MVKKSDSLLKVLKCVLLTLLVIGMAAGTASAFNFRGHTSNETGGMNLSGTNASIEVYSFSPGGPPQLINIRFNISGDDGDFNITNIPGNPNYTYKIVLKNFNSTTSTLDYIGPSLPDFPLQQITQLAQNNSKTKFFLKAGGTINISAHNETESKTFDYMVKDTKLGYPVAQNFNNPVLNATVYVPAGRNYSIMIYPNQSFPVSYNLNNLTNYTNNYANITFNTSNSLGRVSGYANLSDGSSNFSDLKIIAYLVEPGNMVYQGNPIPYNMGAMCAGFPWPGCGYDVYNATNGSYDIALPGAKMGANLLLFATAKNSSNSIYYGAFRSVTLDYGYTPVTAFNFSLKELLGDEANISVMNFSQPPTPPTQINVTTKKLSFQLQNASNASDLPNFAHVEVKVNYSAYSNVSTFSWMADVSQSDSGLFKIPAISADIKKINVFTQGFAPLKTSRTAAQLTQPVTINLTSFNPGRINDSGAPPEIFIDMLKGKPECDVPYPPAGCSFLQRDNKSGFNPFKVVVGGGKISFRMTVNNTNITVHYKNVDMMASGPPDALFDNNATDSHNGSALEQAWRFGSMGPEIYDEVLVGIPLAGNVGADNVTVRLGKLYDDNWNVTWNIDVNTTDQLPSDYRDFNPTWFTTAGMPCSNSDQTADCYVSTQDRMVWLTIPHFSGFGAEVSSTVGNVTATLSPNSSIASSTVNMNFTVNDTINATAWFNITFPEGFNAGGAVVNLNINGSSNPANWTNFTAASYVNVSSNDATNVSANKGTIQYINLSNITVPSGAGTYIINVTTGNATLPLNYTVTPRVYGVNLAGISALASTVTAGVNATYFLNLTNTGNVDDTYNLTVTNASSASTAAVNISSVPLNAGASSIFMLNVTNTSAGTFYVNVTATSQGNQSKVSYINTTTIVALRGVNLTNISALSNSTRPETNATYYLRLTNNGSANDTYSLTINNIDSATNASLNVSSVGLSSLASTIFTLNVTNLTGGEFNVTVIATSQGDATKVGYINTTTYVQSSPPITPTNYWGTVRVAGTLNASAAVKVYGANGIEVASNTSIADGNYSVYVPWDDSTTPADEGVLANEKITFRVNGLLASLGGTSVTERTVDGQGTSTRLDLNVTDNQPPVITIFYPANNSNISIFDRVINGSITDNSNINASMGINGTLNNTWTTKGNFSLIANYTAGDNTINVSANDTYGNYNATVIIVHVLPPSNVTNQNITNNTSFNITANATTGVDLVLTTGNNSANVTVTINASTNASDFNATNISNGLGRYVDINATGDTANLTSVKLTMFYYHSDLDKNGNGIITDVGDIDETSLKLYWYWDNATLGNKWLPITTGTNYSTYLDNNGSAGPVVIGSAERNTTANYLSVTMNHFSIYTINGTVIPTPPGGCTSNCGTTSGGGSSGGGGGGGGGASAENFSNILIKERVDLYIFKDKVAAYFFKLTDPIVYVNITGNTNAGEVTTTVEVLKGTSTLVNNISAPGTVYKNVNIWAGTSGFNSPKNIKEGLIVFKILNSWMSDNKVKGKDVVMVKWDGSNWISLETKEVSKDDTHTYFEAKTNLFSTSFAITTTSGTTTGVTETPKPEVTKETPKATATTPKGTPAIPAGLALMMIAGAAYLMRKKEGDSK